MILAFDIGNSNVVMGAFDSGRLLHSWRLHSDSDGSLDEYLMRVRNLLAAGGFHPGQFQGAVQGSVVPKLSLVFEGLIQQLIGRAPLIVRHDLDLGIRIATDAPEQVGQDRIANAVAAYLEYGTALVVIDCGTATKLEVVTEDGDFLGGIICPGLGISAEALFSRAAQLHQVNLELPEKVIGRNTAASIQSGLFHGHAAMITALLDRIREELLTTSSSEPKIIATGGLITRLIPVLPKLIHRDDLTLHGLSRIHLRNVKSPKAD